MVLSRSSLTRLNKVDALNMIWVKTELLLYWEMRAGERGGWCQKAKSSSITAGSEQMTRRIDKSRNSSISISFRDLEATTGRNGKLKAAASGGGGHWVLVFHCESFNTI